MAPALVAVLVPATVLLVLAVVAWPIALALLPFVLFAALAPVVSAGADRPAGRRGARRARAARRLCHRDDPGPLRSRRVPGGRPDGARDFMAAGARLSADPARTAGRPVGADGALETATGLGGLAVAVVGARLAAEHGELARDDAAAADPACRCRRFCRSPRSPRSAASSPTRSPRPAGSMRCIAKSPPVVDGPLLPARPRPAARRSASRVSSFTYPGARRPALERCRPRRSGRRDGGVGRPVGRRQDDDRQPACCASGTRQPGAILIDGVDLRDFELDHLRAPRLAGVAGHLPVQRHPARQCGAGPARGRRGGDPPRARSGGVGRVCRKPARRARHPGRRARGAVVGRPAPAGGDRPRVSQERADPGARRGDLASRRGQRGAGARRARRA